MCEHCGDDDYEDDDYDDTSYEDTPYEESEEYLEAMRDSDKVNAPLLLAELRNITLHPEEWDQGDWLYTNSEEDPTGADFACGTFGCLAGNTVVHQDIELNWVQVTRYHYVNGEAIPYLSWKADFVKEKDEWGDFISIAKKARQLLGLNDVQGTELFSSENYLDDLWETAYTVTGGKITPLDYEEAQRERLAVVDAA